jgi:hypothetical protein
MTAIVEERSKEPTIAAVVQAQVSQFISPLQRENP